MVPLPPSRTHIHTSSGTRAVSFSAFVFIGYRAIYILLVEFVCVYIKAKLNIYPGIVSKQ